MRVFTALVLICQLFLTAQANEKQVINIVSEEWPGFVNASGNGYYMELLRETFPAEHYQLNLQITPYSRALKMTQGNEAHIVLGIWANEHPNELISRYPVEIDLIDAVVRNKETLMQGSGGFNGLRVMSRMGYGFDDLLDSPASYEERVEMDAMLNMVSNGRTDAVLGYKEKILPELKKAGLGNLKIVEDALSEFVVFGFCSTSECDDMRTHFNTEYERLHRNGFVAKSIVNNSQRPGATPPLTPMDELAQ